MLSTNMPSGIQKRRTQHRRQVSTPAVFEAPSLRPITTQQRQPRRHNRNGMSLDLHGLDLEALQASGHVPMFTHAKPIAPNHPESLEPEDHAVSITNLGQPSQQSMQVAQTHSQPQPGFQDSSLRSPVQANLQSPRTPSRTLRAQSPQRAPQSPSKPPTEQQLKDLHEHIQSVYGSCGQVFINILPTPVLAPQKHTQMPNLESLPELPEQQSFENPAVINLEPTSSAMRFDFENPDIDMGYESSSYYTSDAFSPSPISSPQQRLSHSFLEQIDEHPSREMLFNNLPPLLPNTQRSMGAVTVSDDSFQQAGLFGPSDIDASLEYTGIAPEEVQRYISEQDATTSKWTCLYQDCGKVFGRRENIRSHVQTHLGDRQYKCNGCGKCFVRQHDLKRHAKIHSGNKPYKCPCSAGFARQDALTRHRQRGMCVGGFPDAVRRQAKRGRPKKQRPDMEQRLEKSRKTKQAMNSAASSVSAGSPYSDARSPSPLDGYEAAQSQDYSSLLGAPDSFNDPIHDSAHPMSFDSVATSFGGPAQIIDSAFTEAPANDEEMASMNLLRHLSQASRTPPLSPADPRPNTASSAKAGNVQDHSNNMQGSSTPSRSSIQSNPFSTPPTSPVEPKDELDELFSAMPDSSCSQFEMEMRSMAQMNDLTSMDSSSYEFLDFGI